ncbi:uncharacterized protein [Physcomitrium patens]|uniref:Uncharacterized protein n=1 Tax=Physcomitrium patens TaxID=3218 RepID=A9SI59_PHYPA|nr:uncharacterized protein At4g13200, chloroplastic-like [Physcomitrium patens]PNR38132.1 hypothetical protein PHYPA_021243 [Physcomitrium patens]|eukprot:XP_024397990.1 uncharacterized protein At4g13200, chloroplastic-like [Physcomitrella patens]
MAMAMLASPSLSSVCSNSGRTPAVSGRQQQQLPGAFSPKTNGDQLARRGVSVRAQQKRGSSGDPESKQLLDAFFLGKALAETVSERIGSLVGELLSDVGQRQAEQQRQIREFQNEVQERAKSASRKAAQKALATDNTVSVAAATQVSPVTYDDEPSGNIVTESTTSATEGANGLPTLPYEDLPPLDSQSDNTTASSQKDTPDF